jgi:hypothetical protein
MNLYWSGGGVDSHEFGGRFAYDIAKTGSWVITATNGPHSADITTHAIDDVEKMPFLENVTLNGTGLTPEISWIVPPGAGADRVRLNVIDRNTGTKLWWSGLIPLYENSAHIDDGVLQVDHPYIIRAMVEDTASGTLYGATYSRAESYFDFTPLEEGEPDQVFLPTVGPDLDPDDEFGSAFMFNIDVEEGVPCFIDPLVAIGYDYAIGEEDTVKFASVTLPEIGNNLFDLYLFNGSNFYLAHKDLNSGETFNFGPSGVDKFRILEIEEEAGLDPNDTTAFITELTFTGSGKFTGTMTPIIAYPATVKINPDKLNLKSKGKFITSYIELSEGSDVGQIDIESVTLNVGEFSIEAKLSPNQIGDFDYDGMPDLMVKFNRQTVSNALNVGENKIKISGNLSGQDVAFQGYDIVICKDK